MSKENRIQAIKKWETQFQCKVISYFLGDRQGLETKMGNDVFSIFYNLLRSFDPPLKRTDRIDLFLYSTGGVTISGFYIANLIREFVNEFNVIIPYKAYSAATLLSMGASKIYMSKVGQLTPIDPSVNSPYNPVAQGQPQGSPPILLPVSVEDCMGYIKLAKKEADLKEDMKDVFLALSNDVRPMALGSVYRAREQIRQLAKKLLDMHIDDEKIKETIINYLTEELLSHDYLISITEAKSLNLNIQEIDTDIENLIWEIYGLYANDLKIHEKFYLEAELGSDSQKTISNERAYIENSLISYYFITERILERLNITRPGGVPDTAIRQRILFEGWKEK